MGLKQVIELSVIIPAFNAENYILPCIESLLSSRIEKMEVLIVDDGSSDNTAGVCEGIEKSYKSVRVYRKPNGGSASARNLGLTVAVGQYICFIDSDDVVGKDYLRIMHEMHKETSVDISIVSFDVRFGDDKYAGVFQDNRCVMRGEEAFHEMLLAEKFSWSPWGKLYKRKLFEGVRFDERLVVGEYLELVLKLLLKAECVAVTSRICYSYFLRKNSASFA
jgi:glycosyltransferase involved in cell wall biosynthesis